MSDYIRIPNRTIEAVEQMSDKEAGKLIKGIYLHFCENTEPKFDNDFTRSVYNKAIPKIKKYKEHQYYQPGRQTATYRNWRMRVLERDEYTCQICGKVGGRLEAHHIRPYSSYPDERYNVNNGITLCHDCHRKVHKK